MTNHRCWLIIDSGQWERKWLITNSAVKPYKTYMTLLMFKNWHWKKDDWKQYSLILAIVSEVYSVDYLHLLQSLPLTPPRARSPDGGEPNRREWELRHFDSRSQSQLSRRPSEPVHTVSRVIFCDFLVWCTFVFLYKFWYYISVRQTQKQTLFHK